MRDSLFRAAQVCKYSPMEEIVGQFQDKNLTKDVYKTSAIQIDSLRQDALHQDKYKMIIWPYPNNTADCIDRANCIDFFLRYNSDYRVITEFGLENNKDLQIKNLQENIIIFMPFEKIIPDLDISDKYLTFKGRRCHAITNELSLGYLHRRGLIKLNYKKNFFEEDKLKTKIINGTTITLSKSKQMDIIKKTFNALNNENCEALEFENIFNVQDLITVSKKIINNGQGVVIRPFSASQGTGISFVYCNSKDEIKEKIDEALSISVNSYNKKYKSDNIFPLTITPFVEATKIDNCVSDIRIFVVYDKNDNSLHAIPGMIRKAQTAFNGLNNLNAGNALTNLNAPKIDGVKEECRVFPATDKKILRKLEIENEKLLSMGKIACEIWSEILKVERQNNNYNALFSYGSVDFVIKQTDKKIVPIEVNGANVGSHPSVHPEFLECFGKATCYALKLAGIGN